MWEKRIWLHGLWLMLCTCGFTCCSGASYMMYWWAWLALIIHITSLMLSETGDSSVIACIFSSTSAAQHSRSGKEDVLNESTPRCTAEDVSNSSTTSWEEYTHAGTTEKSRAQHSTANHRPAANMLGQPGQSTLHVPYKRQPVYRATHRCVSLPTHMWDCVAT